MPWVPKVWVGVLVDVGMGPMGFFWWAVGLMEKAGEDLDGRRAFVIAVSVVLWVRTTGYWAPSSESVGQSVKTAAPAWHADSVLPFREGSSDMRTRLKGSDCMV